MPPFIYLVTVCRSLFAYNDKPYVKEIQSKDTGRQLSALPLARLTPEGGKPHLWNKFYHIYHIMWKNLNKIIHQFQFLPSDISSDFYILVFKLVLWKTYMDRQTKKLLGLDFLLLYIFWPYYKETNSIFLSSCYNEYIKYQLNKVLP